MPYRFYLYAADGALMALANPDQRTLSCDDDARAEARRRLAQNRDCEEVEIWQGRRYVGQGRRAYAAAAGGRLHMVGLL